MFHHPLASDAEVRLLEPHHAETIFAVIDGNREQLRRWLPWVDGTREANDTREFLVSTMGAFAQQSGIHGGIWRHGAFAGVVSLFGIDATRRSGEIGYWLAAEHEGHGLITRAVRQLCEYGFTDRALNRIVIRAATGNIRSQAIPRRLGFVHEGTLRQNEWLYDHYVDHEVFAMLASDWPGPGRELN